MRDPAEKAVAIVGVGAVLPDAPNAPTFWENVKQGRYSIGEVSRDRWDPDVYYDPDPKAPDKSYTKIGGWCRDWEWDPLRWKLPIPPRVADAMDVTQKWAIICAREALVDYGYPHRPLDAERTAVILGNAMGGDAHLYSAARVLFPEFRDELEKAPSFRELPGDVRRIIVDEMHSGVSKRIPPITEDTMPGELANIVAGRIAAMFDFHGPNYITDAACASAMAAIQSAVVGLVDHDYDAVVTGGIDANMAPSIFVKFCKIGALSATGSRPYADGADGFVMGEGGACLLLKRLEDAERDGDNIYAVIRSLGGSSDGRGKGITAPNPVGQRLAVQRAWKNAGLTPPPGVLIEGHGTSTRVGDVAEVASMTEAFADFGLSAGSVRLGSVKSNIGHLKGGAGAVGLLKAAYALRDGVLPPSVNFDRPNPNIDFERSPFRVNTELVEWNPGRDVVRTCGVSAFGFGGTNFHVVMEEYVPGRIRHERSSRSFPSAAPAPSGGALSVEPRTPLRGAFVAGESDDERLRARLVRARDEAAAGVAPPPLPPLESDLRANVRVAIDYGDAAELAERLDMALTALEKNDAGRWKALRAKGIHVGRGEAPTTAFLFTGQGSQYVNMLRDLMQVEPIIADTYREADEVMEPLIHRRLTEYIFVDDTDEAVVAAATDALKQTEITQPAVLATETALSRLLAAYGIAPDMVMGHSLGEYGALVAAGALPFEDGLRAVSARGGAMTQAAGEDNGMMAAAWGPIDEIQKILDGVDGYVVVANINSTKEAVIGGASEAVKKAMEAIRAAGYTVTALTVSHAFHTEIVAAAAENLHVILSGTDLKSPNIPIVANITGEFYPMGPDVKAQMVDILARQVASPVQFVKGLNTLHDAGARLFIELGPKRALYGFADDVVGGRDGVVTLFSNHPRIGGVESFNQALCGLYAAGLGVGRQAAAGKARAEHGVVPTPPPPGAAGVPVAPATASRPPATRETYEELGRMFADVLDRGRAVYDGRPAPSAAATTVCITGASLGLPGTAHVFDDDNVARILGGAQGIDVVPTALRRAMAAKNVTRLVKASDGEASFETIDDVADVVKLAGRAGALDLVDEFGFPEDRVGALDMTTRLAIAAGIDALRDAGIPLVMRYKTTTTGSKLPDRWGLPDGLRDDTGVIFASAFPGYDAFAHDITRYYEHRARAERLADLESLRGRIAAGNGDGTILTEVDRRIGDLRAEIERNPFHFDRRFLFRVLAMGHSQFAEYIGARGPNTTSNGACASATQAVSTAQQWIEMGRCRRVIVISADNITSDTLMEWFGAGFLASGAAATDDVVEEAALPFDRRRHGLIIGMGGAALVLESREAAAERGVTPICDLLSTVMRNSAFHGTRLDVDHMCDVMEDLVSGAESRWGINRHEIAGKMVFVSHETYTPARGGSASAEVMALRRVFGADADRIVIANTKGATGHPMGVGIEDTVAVKILETGVVPPVPNFKEVDPELGRLNLSTGGSYPVEYALRLAAGFGSQIGMSLTRRVASPDGVRHRPDQLGFDYRIADRRVWEGWLERVAGYPSPEVEVYKRTLRVKDEGLRAHLDRTASVSAPEPAVREPERAPAPAVVAPPAEKPAADVPGAQPPSFDAAIPADTRGVATERGVEGDAVDPVAERVMAIIAEKSGYPADMLEMDLDLEADLGIDTVKQAEMFAAVREAYGIPRDENLKLRDFPTLADTVRFVYERRPDLAASSSATTAAPEPAVEALPADKPAAEVPGAQTPSMDPVAERVMAIIAEKSGYPADMLEMDLDLEADLGIDTVKQAEMFAAVREAYGIPRDENLKLRDFPTLADTVRFVYEHRPDLDPRGGGGGGARPAAEAAGDDAPSPSPAETPAGGNAVPRRMPAALLRPSVDRFRPTGVTLEAGARVVVVPDEGGVGRALMSRLEKRGVDVIVVDDKPDAEELEDRVARWLVDGRVQGVYWLPALDVEKPLGEMSVDEWHEATRVRVKLLFRLMRSLGERIGGADTFLVSATRLGGRHGYDDTGAVAPLGGAVSGFTKAFARERPDALVKVVDFSPGRKTAAPADRLIDETCFDPGVVEVGYTADGLRWNVGLVDAKDPAAGTGIALDKDTVFVVTGAAGSIVSAIASDLARASGGTFHLLDLAPPPDRDDPDLKAFRVDREGLKRDLFERLKANAAGGQRVTPKMVERELSGIERRRAALDAIEAVEAAGGRAWYESVDLRDADAVARAMASVRERSGRVDVLLHCAGVEISHPIADKSPEEFDLVFDVKSDGWFNVVRGLDGMKPRSVVVFSSIAGRFGNAAQTDYSAANDLLCKQVSSLRSTSPSTRGVAIDWTAWEGIGMASRGSIPALMARAGIEMLDASVGIPIVRRELTTGEGGEVVVAGALGAMLDERHGSGGVDPSSWDALLDTVGGVMTASVTGMGVYSGLVVETTLDPKEQPFLYDHQIGGTPVLPGVMGIEAMAEAARLAFHDRYVSAIEDVTFNVPFKFFRGEPRTVRTRAFFRLDGDDIVADCRLEGERLLHGHDEPEVTIHFTARVRLCPAPPESAETAPPPAIGKAAHSVGSDDIYRVYFHGPAYRVVENSWREGENMVGLYAGNLPANHAPAQRRTTAQPRWIELCFQTAGIMELAGKQRMGLPYHIDEVRMLRSPETATGRVVAAVTSATDESFDARVVDESGGVMMTVRGYRTTALPDPVEADMLKPLQEAMETH